MRQKRIKVYARKTTRSINVKQATVHETSSNESDAAIDSSTTIKTNVDTQDVEVETNMEATSNLNGNL